MATRKIRLTLSGTQVDGQGPIVDVDFNGTNLDVDLDVSAVHGSTTIVREYTVDIDAGTYNLDVEFKNDIGGDVDRNLYIDKIELANNGVDYQPLVITELNSNCQENDNFSLMGWVPKMNNDFNPDLPIADGNRPKLENPHYNPSQTRTDDGDLGHIKGEHPGDNPRYQYNFEITPVKIWINGTNTFNITFV